MESWSPSWIRSTLVCGCMCSIRILTGDLLAYFMRKADGVADEGQVHAGRRRAGEGEADVQNLMSAALGAGKFG